MTAKKKVTKKQIENENDEQLLVRLLVKYLGPVDLDLVIAADEIQDAGKQKYLIKLNNKRVTDGEADALRMECEHLKNMRIWKILTETLRYKSQERMFVDFSCGNDSAYNAGKFLLYAISVLEHIVWSCSNPVLLAEQRKKLQDIEQQRRDKRERWQSTERGGQIKN